MVGGMGVMELEERSERNVKNRCPLITSLFPLAESLHFLFPCVLVIPFPLSSLLAPAQRYGGCQPASMPGLCSRGTGDQTDQKSLLNAFNSLETVGKRNRTLLGCYENVHLYFRNKLSGQVIKKKIPRHYVLF